MTDYSGQVLADKYRVDSLMRKTPLGDFYHGTHLSMGKAVTIKILPPALAVDATILQRFRDEARALARLSHPNVLGITDEGTDATRAEYIVFESAAGETLKDAVRADRQFSLERAHNVTRQIAGALSVAHASDVIHGNLTSENVILTKAPDGSDFVKVLNFGVDSLDPLDCNELDEDMSNLRSAIEYMSPEQCSETTEPDARSDVYSLGVVLYEMLAGAVPFTAEKPSDVMLKHAQEPPLSLVAFRNDLPNDVNQIILTALAKNPDARYQTPNELAADLYRVVASIGSVKPVYPHLSRPAAAAAGAAATDAAQNNIWKTAFIVFAGIAVLGGFFIYMTQVKQTNPPTQLQTDANGQPVQPVNPPVGTSEQSLANMGGYAPDLYGNSNMVVNGVVQQPQVMPGGDGYDPWARGGVPPPGAPPGNYNGTLYVPPPGQIYDGSVNPNSPFMQDGNTYILVPKNTNTNVNAQAKKPPAANANTQTAPPSNTTAKPSPAPPAANTAAPPDSKAKPTPTPKPAASPKNNQPKNNQSGKELDT